MISAAIVGLGRWGRNLVDSVRQSEAIRFTTAHTRTATTAADYCREHGLRWVYSLDAILRDPAIDAVVFATPHSQHAQQIMLAAGAGKAVFVEKPIALSVADAKAAIAAAERAGVVLAVGFNRRFHPSMGLLRRAVKEKRLGTIATISAEQTALHGLAMTQDAWRAQEDESPAGAMTAIGVHLVDGMIDLLGRVDSVYCRVARRAVAFSDDTTDILLSFANGASGHIFCSAAATPHYRMAVYGTEGFAEIIGHPMQTFRLLPALDHAQNRTGDPEVTETAGFNMLTAELEAFAASIANRRPFPTPLADILHGVDVFEAVVQSAATGQPKRVSLSLREA
jgi:predicted dehydrogenase